MITDYRLLACDSCGSEKVVRETSAEAARLAATREGWKSFTYANLLIESRAKARLWDCCPDCPLPERADVLARMTSETEATQ